mmetsp:Transcript_8832/g.21865  ORF Transcript_8832/g.21865 Transcript_8832/m.21865 type:complete len:215 (+) Transcript_8832:16244-16888(+)
MFWPNQSSTHASLMAFPFPLVDRQPTQCAQRAPTLLLRRMTVGTTTVSGARVRLAPRVFRGSLATRWPSTMRLPFAPHVPASCGQTSWTTAMAPTRPALRALKRDGTRSCRRWSTPVAWLPHSTRIQQHLSELKAMTGRWAGSRTMWIRRWTGPHRLWAPIPSRSSMTEPGTTSRSVGWVLCARAARRSTRFTQRSQNRRSKRTVSSCGWTTAL